MDVHDIIYIDVPRFESLASQLLSGLTQITTISEVFQRGKTSLAEHEARAVQEGSGRQVGSMREVHDLDNSFREFLDRIKDDVIDVSSNDIPAAKAACEAALVGGQFVRAQGPFFYHDFGSFKSLSESWLKYQESHYKIWKPSDEERKNFENTKKGLHHGWTLAEFAFGDLIECGVAIGKADNGLLVKASLGRAHMRSSSAAFVDRYGTKTHCRFTVLGTVARVGWQGDADIIDSLTTVTDENNQGFKKTIETTQELAVKLRRNMSGGDAHSVHLMPLAVYRAYSVQDPPAKPA